MIESLLTILHETRNGLVSGDLGQCLNKPEQLKKEKRKFNFNFCSLYRNEYIRMRNGARRRRRG